MLDHTDNLLTTEGLELTRYTNESGEFCIDASLSNAPNSPTETVRFKIGDTVSVQQTNGEYLTGTIIGPPDVNETKPSAIVDNFKAMAQDTDNTMMVNVTHVTVNGSKLPQLSPLKTMVDPSQTDVFQDRLEAFIHKMDMMDIDTSEPEIFPEPGEEDIGAPA